MNGLRSSAAMNRSRGVLHSTAFLSFVITLLNLKISHEGLPHVAHGSKTRGGRRLRCLNGLRLCHNLDLDCNVLGQPGDLDG